MNKLDIGNISFSEEMAAKLEPLNYENVFDNFHIFYGKYFLLPKGSHLSGTSYFKAVLRARVGKDLIFENLSNSTATIVTKGDFICLCPLAQISGEFIYESREVYFYTDLLKVISIGSLDFDPKYQNEVWIHCNGPSRSYILLNQDLSLRSEYVTLDKEELASKISSLDVSICKH